jgi:hypothetical protein
VSVGGFSWAALFFLGFVIKLIVGFSKSDGPSSGNYPSMPPSGSKYYSTDGNAPQNYQLDSSRDWRESLPRNQSDLRENVPRAYRPDGPTIYSPPQGFKNLTVSGDPSGIEEPFEVRPISPPKRPVISP